MDTGGVLEIAWTVLAMIGLGTCVRLGWNKVLDIRSTDDPELRLIALRTLRTYLGVTGVFALFAIIGFRAITIPSSPNPLDHWALVLGWSFIGLEIYLTVLVVWLDWTAGRIRRFSRDKLANG